MTDTKIAIITGTGRVGGVGAVTAMGLAKLGYQLILSARRDDQEIQEIAANCRKEGAKVLIHIGALTGKASSIAYAAAKGALNTLTLALANALAPEVRVNAVCPAFIDSSWWRDKISTPDKYAALKKGQAENNLLQRVLTPDDVTKAILSMIDNPVMTGEIMRLDAGAHIGKGSFR